MAYLTPKRLRRMRTGANLSGYSDAELVETISQATGEVDAFCNQPLTPSPGTFLGGVLTGEQHRWRFPASEFDSAQRRIYPYHWPIQSVEGLKIVVGSGAEATLPVNTLVINNAERWVEITALSIASSAGLFGVSGWIVPIGGISVPVAVIDYTSGYVLPETDDVCYPIDDTNLVFAGSHLHWIDDSDAPTIKVDGTTTAPDSIDFLEGEVSFSAPVTGRVTATYRHKLPREIPLATGLVAAAIVGLTRLRERGMDGLELLRVNEIEIRRPRTLAGMTYDLESLAPGAARLLAGYRYFRIG